MKRIIVIGGGAAGAKAASKAHRLDDKNYVEIFTKSDKVSVSLCGLPYFIEGSVKDINDLIIRTPQQFIDSGIPVFTNYELEQIIPEKNVVIVNGKHVFYDELILALGANVRVPEVENAQAKNIFCLRSTDDALAIKEKMQNSSSVLILGGGYIALELAQAFIKNGLKVILVEKNPSLLYDFDEDFSALIRQAVADIAKDKIEMYFSKEVTGFSVNDNGEFKAARCSEGLELFADFCVLSTGIIPNVEIAKNAGVQIGSTGAIDVDNKMRTNFKNIYAAGDCAQKYSITTKKPIYIGLGSIANKEGRVAAINATANGQYEDFDGILASSITGFMDFTVSKTGLTMRKAQELAQEINIEPVCSTIVKKDKAGYMPDSFKMTLKIVADKRSGEILGAQGAGCANVAARINTITSLLKTRATIEDLLDLDLPYAPPFSGSIDPVLTAAYQLKDLLRK